MLSLSSGGAGARCTHARFHCCRCCCSATRRLVRNERKPLRASRFSQARRFGRRKASSTKAALRVRPSKFQPPDSSSPRRSDSSARGSTHFSVACARGLSVEHVSARSTGVRVYGWRRRAEHSATAAPPPVKPASASHGDARRRRSLSLVLSQRGQRAAAAAARRPERRRRESGEKSTTAPRDCYCAPTTLETHF